MFAQGWKRTFGRVVRRGWIASAILAPVALVGLWLAFQHKPAWYQPVRLDDEEYQLARREAVATADSISDQIVQGRAFDLVLRDRSVNEWLAAWPRVSPEARRALPPELHDPAVRFTDERIRVGAHYEKSGWQAIVSVDLALRVSPDGINLTIALAAVRGGSLPVPRAIVERLLGPLLERARRRHNHNDAADTGSPWGTTLVLSREGLDNLYSTAQLFEGVTIRNRFVWPNGRRPFRIESIRITDGELRLRIQPL